MKQFSLGKRRRPYAATIGGVFVLLALIGMITVIGFCIRGTASILDNSKEKKAFEDVIMPVLMFDPVPYENASDLDPLFVLRSSVWAALLEKKDSYIYDDMNRMTVPSTDVDVACARLFGPNIKLQHQSFETYTAATYVYHEEGKAYLVPIEAETILYTPKVLNIEKKGDTYTLIVGYIPPGNSWILQDISEGDPEPDKYMQYVLKENENGTFRLAAIQDPPEGSVPELMQQQQLPQQPFVEILPNANKDDDKSSVQEEKEPEKENAEKKDTSEEKEEDSNEEDSKEKKESKEEKSSGETKAADTKVDAQPDNA